MAKRHSGALAGYSYNKKICMQNELTEKSEFLTVRPDAAVDSNSQFLSFTLPTSENYVYDLRNFMLSAILCIKKNRGKPQKIGYFSESKDNKIDPVTFCNLPLDSSFNKIEIYINDVSVLQTEFHQFRSLLEKSISYSEQAKYSTIATQLFIKDNVPQISLNTNAGLVVRGQMTQGSQLVAVETKLCHDLMNLRQYIPGQMKLRLVLYRASDAFLLNVDKTALEPNKQNSVNEYFVEIKNPQMLCRRIYLTEKGRNYLSDRLKRPLFFYLQSLKIASLIIPPNAVSWESVVNFARMPTRIIVAFVQTPCVYGDYFMNSLFFQGHSLNSITLKSDGVAIDNLQIEEWSRNGIIGAYNKLLHIIQITNTALAVDITPEQFLNGPYTLFGLSGSDNSSTNLDTTVSLSFKFSEPVPEQGLTAIIFGMHSTELTISNGVPSVNTI